MCATREGEAEGLLNSGSGCGVPSDYSVDMAFVKRILHSYIQLEMKKEKDREETEKEEKEERPRVATGSKTRAYISELLRHVKRKKKENHHQFT